MSTITTLNSSDTGPVSRGVINTNFTNLNTDKADLASPALTGNPTAPTQLAGDNSTKLATTAYVDALPTLGSAKTLIPKPVLFPGTQTNPPIINAVMTTNTTARLILLEIPFQITINKVSFLASTNRTPGTIDISLYSEDGQTQIFSVTTASVSGAGLVTTAVPSVVVDPGNYYLVTNANGTTDLDTYNWYTTATNMDTTNFNGGITSEPILCGTLTITAGTPPTTFSPTALTASDSVGLSVRFDN